MASVPLSGTQHKYRPQLVVHGQKTLQLCIDNFFTRHVSGKDVKGLWQIVDIWQFQMRTGCRDRLIRSLYSSKSRSAASVIRHRRCFKSRFAWKDVLLNYISSFPLSGFLPSLHVSLVGEYDARRRCEGNEINCIWLSPVPVCIVSHVHKLASSGLKGSGQTQCGVQPCLELRSQF